MVHERLECLELLSRLTHEPGRPEDHHGSIVDGVMKRRPSQDESINQGDSEARRNSLLERLQHPAGRGSVHVDRLADAHVCCWNHERLGIRDESQMTDHPRVENLVDDRPVVDAARAGALQSSARSKLGVSDMNGPFSWGHEMIDRIAFEAHGCLSL